MKMFNKLKRIIISTIMLYGMVLVGITASAFMNITPAYALGAACTNANQTEGQANIDLWSNVGQAFYVDVTGGPNHHMDSVDQTGSRQWTLCWTVDGGTCATGLGCTPYWGTFYLYNQNTGDYTRDRTDFSYILTDDSVYAGIDEAFHFQCYAGYGSFELDHDHTGHYVHNNLNEANVYPLGTLDVLYNSSGSGFCY